MDLTTVHVVVPVRGHSEITRCLCDQLQQQAGWERCWIYDNGSLDDTADYLNELSNKNPAFVRVEAAGVPFYRMWEQGLDRATESGADFVAILNNDIFLAPDSITTLTSALQRTPQAWISYPDYERRLAAKPAVTGELRKTRGPNRIGGMSGWCFMVRAQALNWRPLIDPIFHIWYGDDDLAFEVERRGGWQVRVMGLPLDHMVQATSRDHPELLEKIPADEAAFVAKWGHINGPTEDTLREKR